MSSESLENLQDVTLGEVFRNLQSLGAEVRVSLKEIQVDVKSKASTADLAEFKTEIRNHNERIALLETAAQEARFSATNAVNERVRAQRRLTIIYSIGLIATTIADSLLHIFVK